MMCMHLIVFSLHACMHGYLTTDPLSFIQRYMFHFNFAHNMADVFGKARKDYFAFTGAPNSKKSFSNDLKNIKRTEEQL